MCLVRASTSSRRTRSSPSFPSRYTAHMMLSQVHSGIFYPVHMCSNPCALTPCCFSTPATCVIIFFIPLLQPHSPCVLTQFLASHPLPPPPHPLSCTRVLPGAAQAHCYQPYCDLSRGTLRPVGWVWGLIFRLLWGGRLGSVGVFFSGLKWPSAATVKSSVGGCGWRCFGGGLEPCIWLGLGLAQTALGWSAIMVVVYCVACLLAGVCDRVAVAFCGRVTGVGGVVVAAIDGDMGGSAASR